MFIGFWGNSFEIVIFNNVVEKTLYKIEILMTVLEFSLYEE